MANAPVCSVSVNQVIIQPPVKQLPSIPQPKDLPSALQAINMLIQYVYNLSGRTGAQGPQGVPGQAGKPGPKPQNGRFTEIERATQDVVIPITDTGDPPSITVKRINALTFQDNVTGEIWSWNA